MNPVSVSGSGIYNAPISVTPNTSVPPQTYSFNVTAQIDGLTSSAPLFVTQYIPV